MNPSKKWTVREIQQWIREQTEKANKIVEKVFKGEYTDSKYNEEIRKVQKATGQKRSGLDKPISLLFRGKKKKQLLSQARKLRNFFKADEEIRAKQESDKRANRAYNTFKENFGNVDRDTFNRMRDVFGGLNLKDWNVESDYVAGNIVDKLEEGYTVQEITDAWNAVLADDANKAMTSYNMVQQVNAILMKSRSIDAEVTVIDEEGEESEETEDEDE